MLIAGLDMVSSAEGVFKLREVGCKSALSKSGLACWALNCYVGCEHGCTYCYARFASRFSHPGEPWGSFVDVRINAPQVLAQEVRRKRVGRVFVSSVCDGWQPREESYYLTRRCLEILLHYGFPVTILTKSALAGRDLDLLGSGDGVSFGVTLTTFDEGLRRLIEPKSSPTTQRLALLEEAKIRGIKTYAFLGPLLPYLSDTEENLLGLLEAIRDVGVDYFYIDRLNPRYGVWPSLKRLLERHFPYLVREYQKILFDGWIRMEYSEKLRLVVNRLARKLQLDEKMRQCF